MANCGKPYFVNYLKEEYPNSSGIDDLLDTLENLVIHTLTEEQIATINNAKNLNAVDDEILYLVAKALYVDQNFKEREIEESA